MHPFFSVRQVRLATGLVLFAYVSSHLLNHACGLLGLAAMEAGRKVFLAVWRSPPGAVLLYLSLASHLALALWSLCALAAAQDMAPPVQAANAPTFAVGGARVRIDNGGGAAVSRDGGRTFAALPATDPLLHLRAGTFDPQLGAPAQPPSLGARTGARLFVVQARTAILPEYRDALVLAGLEVVAYLPAQAYAVRGGGDARLRTAAQPWVRWVGEFPIGWKLARV